MSTRANRQLRAAFERDGILVEHDRDLPSASSLVAGEPVRGSWWAHPAAHDIYDALQLLHADATRVKLVNGKATLVHRRLWPELVAIGRARRPWQEAGLRDDARAMLGRVNRYRRLVAVPEVADPDGRKPATIVLELERRLLVHAKEGHTESGAHAKRLETWRSFQRWAGVPDDLPDLGASQRCFETVTERWTSTPILPWQ